jgi:hypothetical protein
MFEPTETGYRITFEEFESPVHAGLAQAYFRLLSDIWGILMVFPPTPAVVKRANRAIDVARLSTEYLEEMLRCVESDAFLAAGIVGCALLESILLLACMRDRDEALATEAWRLFASKNKRRKLLFADLVLWIDLGNLVLIGLELGWFSKDNGATVAFFASFVGHEELISEFPELHLTPFEAISKVHELRNHVHPGNCVRGRISVNERTSKLSVGLVYASLAGLLNFYRGDPVPSLDLVIPEPMRRLRTILETPDILAPAILQEDSAS